ncbi:TNF receptor-associated factor 3-like [Lampetra fluviatilis]
MAQGPTTLCSFPPAPGPVSRGAECAIPSESAVEPLVGGYTCDFTSPPEPRYLCGSCHLALRDPHQTGCGHRLCLTCAKVILSAPSPACPECASPLAEHELYRDACCTREVLGLLVFCSNRTAGCEDTVALRHLETHRAKCPYERVLCDFPRCGTSVQRTQLATHRTSCPHRAEFCKYCSAAVTCSLLERHHKEECAQYPLPCPNNCEEHGIPRAELSQHMSACAMSTKLCGFHMLGCTFKGTSESVREHEEAAVRSHFTLVISRNSELELQCARLQCSIEDHTNMSEMLTQRVAQLEQDLSHWSTLTGSNNTRLGSTLEMLTQHNEQLQSLHMAQRAPQRDADTAALRRDMATLRERLRALEGALGNPSPCEKRCHTHEQRLTMHDSLLDTAERRLQVLETAGYSGKLVWKIRDYARRKQEAASGRTLSLYSQPFYTSPFGYKMCARAYLNGDGVGRNTHLSLFFVVMRGEYDALLEWPFRRRVTLSLLDQGAARRHLSDTFTPDPASGSFRRPDGDMNVASGCPLFVSHVALEGSSYLVDDTVFVRVVVDPGGASDP